MAFNTLTAQEAAEMINNGETVGLVGLYRSRYPSLSPKRWQKRPHASMRPGVRSKSICSQELLPATMWTALSRVQMRTTCGPPIRTCRPAQAYQCSRLSLLRPSPLRNGSGNALWHIRRNRLGYHRSCRHQRQRRNNTRHRCRQHSHLRPHGQKNIHRAQRRTAFGTPRHARRDSAPGSSLPPRNPHI